MSGYVVVGGGVGCIYWSQPMPFHPIYPCPSELFVFLAILAFPILFEHDFFLVTGIPPVPEASGSRTLVDVNTNTGVRVSPRGARMFIRDVTVSGLVLIMAVAVAVMTAGVVLKKF